ncbi:PREDICTED: cytochrome P450 2J3-like [Thamnophis sirtalis]|uniref:Cytochrome P450 2J3-like n=1 Tax=Thamnophis sirtalis TaxID=35019 RepID=A0A6I9YZK0_9SAUR|nr:PREDICTED: cytochrome P450 2J3-like [Thamnophis sirtalis]
MTAFGWLIVLSLLFLWFWMNQRPKGFPPGPWRLPLLGNLLQLIKRFPLKELDQLGKKYGPVFSLYLGRTPLVLIYGFPSVEEVLVIQGIEFAGRASFPITDVHTRKKGLLALRYGEIWKGQRKFSQMLFRNFRSSKKSVEEKILEETSYLIQAFTDNRGVPLDTYEFLDTAVANIICAIIFGKRWEYGNGFFRTFLDQIHLSSKMTTGPWALLYNEVPLVRSLPLPHQTILRTAEKIYVFIQKEVEEHKATLTPGEPRDFTDAYLEEIQKPEKKSSGFEEEQLRVLLSDLFLAGTETTAAALQWTMLYLVAFPEIQEKCWKEIDTMVGNKAILEYADRKKLPYTNAVIHEIQRVSNVVPFAIPHAPIKDVQLFGYKIPKCSSHFLTCICHSPTTSQSGLSGSSSRALFVLTSAGHHGCCQHPPERKGSSFEEEQLRVLLYDLINAGTETTSGTLQWAFLYLVAFPEIQEKCWKEIDKVLGNKARLKHEDRIRLPYTNAVIHEIQRTSNIVPLGVAHKAINDVHLLGYKIPKVKAETFEWEGYSVGDSPGKSEDTMVVVNIQSAHHDESQWKFPNEFNPSNFLNEEGEFVKPEAFLAFSAGPRVCVGENLAQMELFLFFTSILRNFQLLWPDKSQAPDFTPHSGIAQFPSRFKVLLKSR